jgi:hypothetical protein
VTLPKSNTAEPITVLLDPSLARKLTKEASLRPFFQIAQWYAPEPWNDKYPLDPADWIFDEYESPPWKHDLKNAKKGYPTSIDNCSGEFLNYHRALAQYFSEALTRVFDCQIQVQLQQLAWMKTSDQVYEEDSQIPFTMHYSDSYPHQKAPPVEIIISRRESSDAREHPASLEEFLREELQRMAQEIQKRQGTK